MGSPVTASEFLILMETHLREVAENEWKDIDQQLSMFYGMEPSTKAWETYFSVGALPDATPWTGKVPYASVSPGYTTRIEPGEFAQGIQLERKFIDDNQYNVLKDRGEMLIASMTRAREKSGVATFANAFSTAFAFMTSEEGVSLCNTAHTTKSGVSTSSGFSNSGTSALSKTSLAATWLAMRQFKGDIGQRVDVNPDMLIVPESLYFTALEVTGYDPMTGASSDKDPDSAMHMINPLFKRFKVVPYRRLDDYSSTQWFLVDSKMMKKMNIWIDRIKPEYKTNTDFQTKSVQHAAYGRWGCGFRDWRWIYGQKPA